MRRHSLTGPLLLLLVGGLFLWRNLHPEAPVFDLVAEYWPFLLIAWGLIRLVEVLIWRSEASRFCFTGGEVALVVLICIAGSGMWTAHHHGFHFNAGSMEFWGTQYEYTVSAHAPAAGANRVVFENSRGNITVRGADAPEVTVSGRKLVHSYDRGDADRADQNTPVEIVVQGDRLVVRTNQDRLSGDQRVSDDLTVTVPRGMAVEARGTSGDYDIADIAGDVDLNSERADVRLSRVGGNARIEAGRQRPDPCRGREGQDGPARARLGRGSGEHRRASDHRRRVFRHPGFQEPGPADAASRTQHGAERGVPSRHDHHEP